MEAVRSRWSRAPTAGGPILTEQEVGRLAVEITLAAIALATVALLVAWLHAPTRSLPGDSGYEAGLVALSGLPIIAFSWRRPELVARNLTIVALVGAASLTLDAWFVGPTFAPFVTMSYLWLGLMGTLFLSRRRGQLVLVLIATCYALVLATQEHNIAAVTQWCLTVTGVLVVALLGEALVDGVEQRALTEHELRSEVEATRADLEIASARKSAFLSAMSHELRTPLNAIIGFTEMLGAGLRGPLNDKQSEYIEDIRASGAHLNELIGEVLDVETIEMGQDSVNIAEVAIAPLLAACTSLFRDQADRRAVELVLLVDPACPSIAADERKVRQVVLNLLANAMRHTPSGGRINLQCVDDGSQVRIGVLDTGTGIDPKDHEGIFEEFRQGGEPRAASGTGLGLPLSRRIARLHGGDLTVDSRLGDGSTFWLTLPVNGPQPRLPNAARRTGRAPRPPVKGSLRVTPRRTAELVGSTALFLLLPIALLSVPRPLPAGLHPVPLSLAVLGSLVCRLVLAVLPLSPSAKAATFTTMGILATTGAAASVGPRLAPFVTMFYLWLATTAIAYLSTRVALLELSLAGVCYAVLLVAQEGHTLPFVRWELTMGTVALAALIVRRMLDKLWEIAEDERIAREEIEGANAELDLAYRHKTEFLANMSHELRTPLNVIIGFAEVLSSEAFGSLTEEQAEYVTEILTSARQLLALINDVLDLGKLEAGRTERAPHGVIVRDLLEPALDEPRALAVAHGVDFTATVTQPDTVVEADDVTVRRAVAALAASAVLATSPGHVCRAFAGLDEDGVLVTVIDGGPPLTIEPLRPLLDELVGITEGHDTAQALRLALAAGFAALNGGALSVVAGATSGNTWTLTIPARVLSRR